MDEAVRQVVCLRAGDCCEYCRLKQQHLPFARFQIEHIRPKKHRGTDDASNLALACDRCNSHKGPNLAGIDPQTEQVTELFNPRKHSWEEHFERRGPLILERQGLAAQRWKY